MTILTPETLLTIIYKNDMPLALRPNYNIASVRATYENLTMEQPIPNEMFLATAEDPQSLTSSEANELVKAIKKRHPTERFYYTSSLMESSAIGGDDVAFMALSEYKFSGLLGRMYKALQSLESIFGIGNTLASAVDSCLHGQSSGHAKILEYLQNTGFWSTDEKVTPNLVDSFGLDGRPKPKVYYAPIILAISHAGEPVISFLNAHSEQGEKDEAIAKGTKKIEILTQDAATLSEFLTEKSGDLAATPHFRAWKSYQSSKDQNMPELMLRPQMFLYFVQNTQSRINDAISRITNNMAIIRGR